MRTKEQQLELFSILHQENDSWNNRRINTLLKHIIPQLPMSFNEFSAIANSFKLHYRNANGAGTCDCKLDRLNITTKDNMVTKITLG